MDAYVYRAAYLCEDCAEKERRRIIAEDGGTPDLNSMDSDVWPHGPYANGGGEADCPQHCDYCNLFLENPLTPDGYSYVAEAAQEAVDRAMPPLHRDYPEDSVALTQWLPFYGGRVTVLFD